ncbi:hypothetical protein G5V59_01750 [Nocardioides sp. W3-2-3]|uniref:hypothetical protein n=1 Tax=Nocardioides convexus TaxID=2712224 RepID=UPI00241885B9|nr:hypothetical protein [Nocardioides convexus]NGZ99548.1 hypothetical protein [Nocardioides convexus]
MVWLARHPTAAVFVLLGVIAAFSASLVWLLSGSSSDAPGVRSDAQDAPYTLPTPTQHPPKNRVDAAHKALHALGRACKTPVARRDPEAVRRPLDLMEAFATDFPSGGFRIDDEPGTTLALLTVVWNELKTCDPSLVPEVEELIPAEYRGE